ncbi:MAG TPA: hypothetical protein VF599_07605 [Pyrinomonadaceae bacterium]|jgi:hypothetical protein
MEITAEIIAGIKYKQHLNCNLAVVALENFDVNSAKSSCVISHGQNRLAASKWVSPKRTRSYPYERVYNTLSVSKRITVIPLVKDEGAAGDRDFLQWDTVSLMSLLDVYVILAYYETAEKHRSRVDKITNQKFNNEFVLNKIREISNYHSSALHWNLNELKSIGQLLETVKESYRKIAARTQAKFHGEKGLDDFSALTAQNLSAFMESSRSKAQSAQAREFLTSQPKEILSTATKAKITITNYLGGKYFFTVDEILINDENLHLIESKHSKSGKLPSTGDIKDGLLKMMLYSNLENVSAAGKIYKSLPVLRLTSENLAGKLTSSAFAEEQSEFFRFNKLNARQILLMKNLFAEARENNFSVILEKG